MNPRCPRPIKKRKKIQTETEKKFHKMRRNGGRIAKQKRLINWKMSKDAKRQIGNRTRLIDITVQTIYNCTFANTRNEKFHRTNLHNLNYDVYIEYVHHLFAAFYYHLPRRYIRVYFVFSPTYMLEYTLVIYTHITYTRNPTMIYTVAEYIKILNFFNPICQ